jgi:hypothetical protein
MNEDIIKWAHEAGFFDDDQQPLIEHLARLAALVRADEREACAKVCYELPWKDMDCIPSNLAFAAAIRERNNHHGL